MGVNPDPIFGVLAAAPVFLGEIGPAVVWLNRGGGGLDLLLAAIDDDADLSGAGAVEADGGEDGEAGEVRACAIDCDTSDSNTDARF